MSTPPSRRRETKTSLDAGAVILIGGASQRMGRPKWSLKIGKKTLLERLVSQLASVTQQITISAKKDQLSIEQIEKLDFPKDLVDVVWAFDTQPNSGPQEGIRVGLESLSTAGLTTAFVTAVDVPIVRPSLVEHLFELCEGYDGVVPFRKLSGGKKRYFGMTAVYQTTLHRQIKGLIEEGQLKVSVLAQRFNCLQVDVNELKEFDADLVSFQNLNFQHELESFLERFE